MLVLLLLLPIHKCVVSFDLELLLIVYDVRRLHCLSMLRLQLRFAKLKLLAFNRRLSIILWRSGH